MKVGSLFAGIGGFDLGLERAGMETAWQVERDAFCRAVLAKHFPDAQRFEDVRDVGAHNLEPVDLICGGFPCQDISLAGNGAGIDGARSGLWAEFARIICELGPRWVVVENVPALTSRGLDRVLRDLASSGYDAEWDCIPASALGAPHRRDRIWVVAYPGSTTGGMAQHRGRRQRRQPPGASQPALLRQEDGPPGAERPRADRADVPDAPRDAQERPAPPAGAERQRARPSGQRGGEGDVADPEGQSQRAGLRSSGEGGQRGRRSGDGGGEGRTVANADRVDGRGRAEGGRLPKAAGTGSAPSGGNIDWSTEPDVGRVADGVPNRVDRLSALGNALVPQIAEWIGHRILEAEE